MTPGIGELVGLVGLNCDSTKTPRKEDDNSDFMRTPISNPPNPPNPPIEVSSEEMENKANESDGGYDDDGFDFF